MPSKKRKYNARFPAGRIKKIMQTDEEVGKVAQAVPVIISRTLELFVESLLTKATEITIAKNAKTLSPSHMKQCILSESRFDFLKDLVKNIPDINSEDNIENSSTNNSNSSPTTPVTGSNNSFETSSSTTSSTSKEPHSETPSVIIPHCSNQMKEGPNKISNLTSPPPLVPHTTPYHTLPTSYSANFYTEQHPSTTPSLSPLSTASVKQPASSVIQYNTTILGASSNIVSSNNGPPPQPIFHIAIKKPDDTTKSTSEIPPLIPIMQHSDINLYNFSSNNDNLCTDDDYDN